MSTNIIEVHNLTKTYTNGDQSLEVLKGINFNIETGDFVSIMGPSGSGKSTLMHIIGALDVPTGGQYILDGADVGSLNDDQLAEIRNQKIGFVFQAYNLLSRTTVLDNVCLPGVYGGLSKAEREERARKSIEAVGLSDRIDHYSNQLSGGQQQRVAIARSLTMNPKIILADEPTGNLPTNQTAEIMDLFTKLNHEGHTIVMITHEPEVATYTRRILHLRDGVIISEERNSKTCQVVCDNKNDLAAKSCVIKCHDIAPLTHGSSALVSEQKKHYSVTKNKKSTKSKKIKAKKHSSQTKK